MALTAWARHGVMLRVTGAPSARLDFYMSACVYGTLALSKPVQAHACMILMVDSLPRLREPPVDGISGPHGKPVVQRTLDDVRIDPVARDSLEGMRSART